MFLFDWRLNVLTEVADLRSDMDGSSDFEFIELSSDEESDIRFRGLPIPIKQTLYLIKTKTKYDNIMLFNKQVRLLFVRYERGMSERLADKLLKELAIFSRYRVHLVSG
jgi:hypothetical protein